MTAETTKVAIPVMELSDLHARIGRLEGAARMASITLAGCPSSDEIREIGKTLGDLSHGQIQGTEKTDG
jgi:hypothetical protein